MKPNGFIWCQTIKNAFILWIEPQENVSVKFYSEFKHFFNPQCVKEKNNHETWWVLFVSPYMSALSGRKQGGGEVAIIRWILVIRDRKDQAGCSSSLARSVGLRLRSTLWSVSSGAHNSIPRLHFGVTVHQMGTMFCHTTAAQLCKNHTRISLGDWSLFQNGIPLSSKIFLWIRFMNKDRVTQSGHDCDVLFPFSIILFRKWLVALLASSHYLNWFLLKVSQILWRRNFDEYVMA